MNYANKEARLTLLNKSRMRHCSPRFQSPGNDETTGITAKDSTLLTEEAQKVKRKSDNEVKQE